MEVTQIPNAPADSVIVTTRRPAGAGDPAPAATNWYDSMTNQSRTLMQFGFAGLVAVMFFLQNRDFAAEARANREMYREEQHALRAEIRASTQAADTRSDQAEKRMGQLTGQVVELAAEMRRTADVLRSAGIKIEKAAEKVGGEQGTTAPQPRVKGEQTVPALFHWFKGLP